MTRHRNYIYINIRKLLNLKMMTDESLREHIPKNKTQIDHIANGYEVRISMC